MSVYKIIQDIEAEDKLVGPFALRQFVYVLIVAASLFIGYKIGEVAWWLSFIVLPHTLFFALLAAPLGGGQPTEIWLLAKFRFYLKPRKHLWQQEGIRNLVTITVPKKIDKQRTKNLDQTQVQSRLQSLASTLDSHGWSSKHIAYDPFNQNSGAAANSGEQQSDRLVNLPQQSQSASQAVAETDILDPVNSPTAKKLGEMIDAKSRQRRKDIMKKMKENPGELSNSHLKTVMPLNKPGPKLNLGVKQPAAKPEPKGQGMVLPPALGYVEQPPAPQPQPQPQAQPKAAAQPLAPPANQPAQPAQPPVQPPVSNPVQAVPSPVVAPDPASVAARQQNEMPEQKTEQMLTEEELLKKIKKDQSKPKSYGHMRVVHPLGEKPDPTEHPNQQLGSQVFQNQFNQFALQQQPLVPPQTPAAAPAPPDRDIIELANNDDLNVETLARQANKNKAKKPPKGEVVINLHDDE